MSISAFSLSEPAIAQGSQQGSAKKTPPKRSTQAIADTVLVPEPR